MELRAQLKQAQAERKLAQVTLARQQQLAQRQLVSRRDLDTAATDVAVKEAQIGTIEAQIKRNRATLDTAKNQPRLYAYPGADVRRSDANHYSAGTDGDCRPAGAKHPDPRRTSVPCWSKAQVSEADVIHLKPGQKARFYGTRRSSDSLRRYAEGYSADAGKRSMMPYFYYARFEVPNPQGILRLEMTAQVHIQLAEVKKT